MVYIIFVGTLFPRFFVTDGKPECQTIMSVSAVEFSTGKRKVNKPTVWAVLSARQVCPFFIAGHTAVDSLSILCLHNVGIYLEESMETNLSSLAALLRANAYPGRGLMIGKSEDGKKAVFVYFIMGRSKNSRNRVFAEDGNGIIIYPFDPSAVEDPSLIIYHPVRVLGKTQIVTNGDQTDTIFDLMSAGKSFEDALATRKYEPDAPNYTPRISGAGWFDGGFNYKLNILKCPAADGGACGRLHASGVGLLLRQWALIANAKGRYSRGSSETQHDQDLTTIRQKGNVILPTGRRFLMQ
jgi:hypothetical protein